MTDGWDRFSREALIDFITGVFVHLGLSRQDARHSAEVLVLADLRGVDTHGVARMFYYVWKLREGLIRPVPDIRVVREGPCTALIDGDNGMGTLVGQRAMDKTLELAERTGVGVVAVRNSNHYGIAGYYAMQAVPRGMIGVALTNAIRLVLPTFGARPAFGTNPISVAVPTGRERPWVLDMATSVISMGTVEEAIRREEMLQPGWATDPEGRDTMDPNQVIGGYLYPLGGKRSSGGHKGYGLAVLVDILSAVLSGAAFGVHQEGLISMGTSPSNVGHFFAAIRVSNFMDLAPFQERMDRMIQDLHEVPPAEGQDRIFVHGEIEYDREAERLEKGIPLNPNVVNVLRTIAQETGIPFPAAE